MIQRHAILAKKYAAAFLNIFIHELPDSVLDELEALSAFLHAHEQSLFYLKLACIKSNVKRDVLIKLFARFGLCGIPFERFIGLIALHKRLSLITEIVEQLATLYKERKNIVEVEIKSSIPLNDHEQHIFEKFMERALQKTIRYRAIVDASLIAGVRMQSDTWLWEYSIRQKLAAIKRVY